MTDDGTQYQPDQEQADDSGLARFARSRADWLAAVQAMDVDSVTINETEFETPVMSMSAVSEPVNIEPAEVVSVAAAPVELLIETTNAADQSVFADEPLDLPAPIKVSLWTRLYRPKRLAALRVIALDQAIEARPNAPANYALRGEALLKLRRFSDAEMDFRRALDLAAAQVESQDWGVVAQVVQDRALAGLKESRMRR